MFFVFVFEDFGFLFLKERLFFGGSPSFFVFFFLRRGSLGFGKKFCQSIF